ncbi:MAG: response regulator [Pontibacterium sp.]
MDNELKREVDRLAAAFRKELPGRLHQIRCIYDEQDLSAWSADKNNRLYGFLHTLSGTAGTLGLRDLGRCADNLAKRLSEATASGRPGDAEWNAIGVNLNTLEQLSLIRGDKPKGKKAAEALKAKDYLIHIVDDDVSFTQLVASALQRYGYKTAEFHDLTEFIAICKQGTVPDLLLMDMEFPLNRLAGAETLNQLRQELNSHFPAIFISQHDDLPSRLAAFRAGATRYLLKPVDFDQLFRLVDELCSRCEDTPYRVLVADDDPFILGAYVAALENAGMLVEAISNPLQVLDMVRIFKPDVLLMDVYMPEASGPELAAVLREDEQLAWLPILFMSVETDPSKHALALAHGGDDFLIKPIRPAYLQAAVKARAWRSRRNRALWQQVKGNTKAIE